MASSKPGEKGSNEAVIRSKDGSKKIIDKNTGKVKKEFNPEGKQVVRIKKVRRGSGSRGGSFKKVDDQKEVIESKATQAAKALNAKNQRVTEQYIDKINKTRPVSTVSVDGTPVLNATAGFARKLAQAGVTNENNNQNTQNNSNNNTSRVSSNRDISDNSRSSGNSNISNSNVASGSVTATPSPKGIAKVQSRLNKEIGEAKTIIDRPSSSDREVAIATVKRFALTFPKVVVDTAAAVAKPKQTVTNVFRYGTEFTTNQQFRQQELSRFGQRIRNEPEVVIPEIATDLILGKGAQKLARKGSQLATTVRPDFRPVSDNTINVPSSQGGTTSITVAGGVDSTATPIAQQAKVAGTKVDAVSAQRGLFNPLENQKVVDKPLPTPDAPPLERSFFADPNANLRTSRLGIGSQRTPTPEEFVLGEFTIKRNRPQAILFENAPVAQFPQELQGVRNKLIAGKPLTPSEQRALTDFQLQKSGEFKPVGFVSKESEITLAPGEIITRERNLGVTQIQGENVRIIRGGIKVSSPELKELIRVPVNKRTVTQTNRIKTLLQQETGFSSKPVRNVFFDAKGFAGSRALNTAKRFSTTRPALQNPPKSNSPINTRTPESRSIKKTPRANSQINTPKRPVQSRIPRDSITPNIPRKPRGGSGISNPPTVLSPPTGSPSISPPGAPPKLFKGRKENNRNKNFKVEIRRFGEFRSVGRFNNPQKAFSKAFGTLKNTLAASARIIDLRSGKALTPNLGDNFRTAKGDKTIIVQKRKNRLGTIGEKKEIKSFKI